MVNVLVVNCGSSSLKVQLFSADRSHLTSFAWGAVERIGPHAVFVCCNDGERSTHYERATQDWQTALAALVDLLGESARSIDAIGHRVVHGGAYCEPTRIDDAVVAAIEGSRHFAPLHNGPSLEGIRAARSRFPATPMVAVFDTAFHASMPPVAASYALPHQLSLAYRLRRYGYHGIAHRSMSERYAELAGFAVDGLSIVTLQLGNGCSVAAVRGRGSVDTSMGFTPLEGLVMGTRSGDLDPAVVTYLCRECGMLPEQVDEMLNSQSGLLGVSGTSSDMAHLLDQEARGDERAHAAIELFCYRARKYIGAYMAVLGVPQAVVFGGGIGEHAPAVRRRITEPLAPLGIEIDIEANDALVGAEGRFSTDASRISAYVIPSDEERIIAKDTYDLLVA